MNEKLNEAMVESADVIELVDLQLAFVGGGIGETSL